MCPAMPTALSKPRNAHRPQKPTSAAAAKILIPATMNRLSATMPIIPISIGAMSELSWQTKGGTSSDVVDDVLVDRNGNRLGVGIDDEPRISPQLESNPHRQDAEADHRDQFGRP